MADAHQYAGSNAHVATEPATEGVWIERLQLTNFRNYKSLALNVGAGPVVLCGGNGSGKTNLLEAISLLAAGQGLRRAPYPELTRTGETSWALAARLHTPTGAIDVGTGPAEQVAHMRSGRIVRIDGEDRRSGDLDDYVAVAWLTPAMDGLFTGPASERRRFLDRLTSCFDPHYRARLNQFERAMQHRNRLLAENVFDKARFESFEQIMAETGVATAAARLVTLSDMRAILVGRRNRLAHSLFPWAELAIAGRLEAALADRPAIDVEDEYATLLARDRERDREAGRTLEGPHRSDLIVGHGPREMPAKVCSTGEQKALLIGLILAHADLIRYRRNAAPVLLLDEITAHLDAVRRTALFDEIVRLGGQTWMSGTDRTAFHGLEERAQFYRVHDGRIDGFR